MNCLSRALLVCHLSICAPIVAAAEEKVQAAQNEILTEVSSIHGGVQPGRMVVFGESSFPVVNYPGGIDEGPMVAAAFWGQGRVIAVPDHQMLNMDQYGGEGDSGTFCRNGLSWMTRKDSKDIVIAVTRSTTAAKWFKSQGYSNVRVIGSNYRVGLRGADVLFGWLGPRLSKDDENAIKSFVKAGGGLFIADYGVGYQWWWRRPLSDAPGTSLLREIGIGFPLGNRGDTALVSVRERAKVRLNANQLLDLLRRPQKYSSEEKACAAQMMSGLFDVLPVGDALLSKLDQAYETGIADVNPTPASPVRDPFSKALLKREAMLLASLPPEQLVAHRTAEALYGSIPSRVPRRTLSASIDTSVSRWHSTGFYVAPGELAAVSLPKVMVGKGFSVRISGHVDNISPRGQWHRVPNGVARSYPIDRKTVKVASAFGGAIYIDVGAKPPRLGRIEISAAGVLQAPMFVRGETSDRDWIKSIRKHPAPYAELIGERIILSVPSRWIRSLSKPSELMAYWDKAVESIDWVGGYESHRTAPDRINVDVQISAGLLHAGYPIQGPTTASKELVDLAHLNRHGNWGYFHELGHEAQRRPDWKWNNDNPFTFPGDIEVTVNIFANRALETLVPSVTPNRGWGWSAHPEHVMKRAQAAIRKPGTFDEKKNPYPFYFQLADGFGWDVYRQVLASYSQDQDHQQANLPRNPQEEKDQWMIRFSEKSGHDLVMYMARTWGLRVSQRAIDHVTSMKLQPWMPIVAQESAVYSVNNTVTMPLVQNALTLDGAPKLIRFDQPKHGVVRTVAPGSLEYKPRRGFRGEDSFAYRLQTQAGNVTDVEMRLSTK